MSLSGCVNDASAINLGSIEEVPLKRFDLTNGIHARHLRSVAGLHSAPEGPAQPAHPDAVATDPAGAHVAQAHRLHDGKVRNVVVRVSNC